MLEQRFGTAPSLEPDRGHGMATFAIPKRENDWYPGKKIRVQRRHKDLRHFVGADGLRSESRRADRLCGADQL